MRCASSMQTACVCSCRCERVSLGHVSLGSFPVARVGRNDVHADHSGVELSARSGTQNTHVSCVVDLLEYLPTRLDPVLWLRVKIRRAWGI